MKASRDTSLIRTDYEYDVMGWLVWIKPETGHDGWTNYVYTRTLNSSNPAQVQILRSSNGGDTTLAESLLKYDSFGRLWQEQAKMADGTFLIRQTNYNALHWKTSVSEQGNTAKLTQYLSYDPFGRSGTIRPPDGSAHDVTLTYSGVRHVSRTSKVGNSHSGGTINEVPFVDPFEASGLVNPEEVGMEESKLVGEITRDIELALVSTSSTTLFGRGAWLNRGRFRIGHSDHRNVRYFTIRHLGRHFDLYVVRYLKGKP